MFFFYLLTQAANAEQPASHLLRKECALYVDSAISKFRSLTDLQALLATCVVMSLGCAFLVSNISCNTMLCSEEEKASNGDFIMSLFIAGVGVPIIGLKEICCSSLNIRTSTSRSLDLMRLENNHKDPSVWLNRFLQRSYLDPNLAIIAEGLKKFQFASLNELTAFIDNLYDFHSTRSENQLKLSKEVFVSELIKKNSDLEPLKEKLTDFYRYSKAQDWQRFLKEFDEPFLGGMLVSFVNLENAVFFTIYYYLCSMMLMALGEHMKNCEDLFWFFCLKRSPMEMPIDGIGD